MSQTGPAGGEPAIDFVSPLPPVRSGIADYSRDLLPHLAPLCDLRVIRLPGQPVAEELVERWRPAAAESCGEGGRLPLYQMGNNVYHQAVHELALERPGVVTLHDVVLHHLVVEVTLGGDRSDLAAYRRWLAADHAWPGDAVGRARRWNELGDAAMFTLPVHRTLLRRQRGVLVHSRWAADRLREDDDELAVRVVPMGVPLPPPADEAAGAAFRRRLGVPAGAPLLGSFGFQTPIKRTAQAVRSLARPELAAAHLLIAGEVSPVVDLPAVAGEAGVADRVHVTGFLGYDEFEAAIAACDLCVNLRYPTAGETSASLLRVLAVGRPGVVSDYAQFRELPAEVAVRAPLGEGEVAGLAAVVGELLDDPARLAAMARAAREFVGARHDPAKAAAAAVDACRELAERRPPGDRPARLAPPTTLAWRRLTGSLEVEGAEPPWPVGDRRRLRLRLHNSGEARWLAGARGAGGVMLDLHWRRAIDRPREASRWLPLGRDLEPGEATVVEVELRRPVGCRLLVIEPHVAGVAGFSALGGPSWVSEI